MTNYKPYYRTTEQKKTEKRQAMVFGISLLAMVILSFVGTAFVLVKAMLYVTGLFI
jgi:type IV secretory pathway VirB3-like protein